MKTLERVIVEGITLLIFFILAVIVALFLFGCSGGGDSEASADINPAGLSPSSDHVKYYGWFHVNTAFGDHIDAVKNHSNIAFISVDHIEQTIDAGLIPLVYVDPRECFMSMDWQKQELKAERWQQIIDAIRPYEDIVEIYVMDEPYGWSGNPRFSHKNFQWVVDMWRDAFPDIVLWTDFLNIDYVPPELDIIMLTPDYHEGEAEEYRYKINKMYKKMHSGQEFVICTPAFLPGRNHSKSRLQWRVDTAAEYLDIMLYDKRVVGALHFIYPTPNNEGLNSTGSIEMPEMVKEIEKFYREEIKK